MWKGQSYSVRKLAEIVNISVNAMSCRVRENGYIVDDRIMQTVMPHKVKPELIHKYKGKEYTRKELAAIAGLSESAITLRLGKTGGVVNEWVMRPKTNPIRKKVPVIEEDGTVNVYLPTLVERNPDVEVTTIYNRYNMGRKYRDIKSLIAPSFMLPLKDSVFAKDFDEK